MPIIQIIFKIGKATIILWCIEVEKYKIRHLIEINDVRSGGIQALQSMRSSDVQGWELDPELCSDKYMNGIEIRD